MSADRERCETPAMRERLASRNRVAAALLADHTVEGVIRMWAQDYAALYALHYPNGEHTPLPGADHE